MHIVLAADLKVIDPVVRGVMEIVRHTDAPIYLLDEWDANLDPNNRAAADALVEELARRARVVEISHRDRS